MIGHPVEGLVWCRRFVPPADRDTILTALRANPAMQLGGSADRGIDVDFHLLLKPVLPNKLRAMIAFKLGVR